MGGSVRGVAGGRSREVAAREPWRQHRSEMIRIRRYARWAAGAPSRLGDSGWAAPLPRRRAFQLPHPREPVLGLRRARAAGRLSGRWRARSIHGAGAQRASDTASAVTLSENHTSASHRARGSRIVTSSCSVARPLAPSGKYGSRLTVNSDGSITCPVSAVVAFESESNAMSAATESRQAGERASHDRRLLPPAFATPPRAPPPARSRSTRRGGPASYFVSGGVSRSALEARRS